MSPVSQHCPKYGFAALCAQPMYTPRQGTSYLITESSTLEETLRISKSNCQPNTATVGPKSPNHTTKQELDASLISPGMGLHHLPA